MGLLQSFIPNVEVELERLDAEREENISFMQDNFDAHNPQYADDEEETWDIGSKDKEQEEEQQKE